MHVCLLVCINYMSKCLGVYVCMYVCMERNCADCPQEVPFNTLKNSKYVCIYCVQKGESNLPLWRSKQPHSIILLRNVAYIPAVVHRRQVRARLEAEEELLRGARHGPVETETVQQLQQRVALVLRVLIAYIHT